jgi:threonine/homoserine/homoserine lactone efflux protein
VFGTHDLWLFVLSGLLLNITPGPDTLYIVGRSTSQGWRAGAVVHVCAAALGLSAILAASAAAYTAVKIIGAAYLVYVGVSLIRSKGSSRPSTVAPDSRPAAMWGIFIQGFLTNVLNPKVALFFVAFLPQFVLSDAPSKPLAFLFLGVIFDVNGTVWNLLVAWSTARISSRFDAGGEFKTWFNRCVGSLFVFVGIRLALAHDR